MELQQPQSLLKIFWIFFKIGMITIGGGMAMIPLVEFEIVGKQKWMSTEEFIEIYAFDHTLPGIIIANLATHVGYRVAGVWGAVSAIIATTLPSFIAILIVAITMPHFIDIPLVQKAFTGVEVAVGAMILVFAVNTYKKTIKNRVYGIIAIVAACVAIFTKTSAVYIIGGGGLLGLIMHKVGVKNG